MDDTLIAILAQIGLSEDEIAVAQRLYNAGQSKELQKYLRVCRSELMDQLHTTQQKVDILDYLIRQTKGGALS